MEKETSVFQKPLVIVVMAVICCALWGSATPFIKIGYEYILPERDVASTILFAGVRFALAGLLTIAIFSAGRRRLLYPKKENLGRVLIIAACQTVIQYIFFYIGLANTSGVKGTIASGSSTFFAILISSLILKQEKLTAKKIIACVLGFIGIITVNLSGLIGDGGTQFTMNFLGDGFVIFSAIAYAISSVLIKRFSSYEDPVTISGYQFFIGGAFMSALGLALGGKISLSSIHGVIILVYLALLSAIAYSLWGILLKYNPVSRITVFSFGIPVFGVLLSELMLEESSATDPLNLLIALILVCAGIFLINYKTKKER